MTFINSFFSETCGMLINPNLTWFLDMTDINTTCFNEREGRRGGGGLICCLPQSSDYIPRITFDTEHKGEHGGGVLSNSSPNVPRLVLSSTISKRLTFCVFVLHGLSFVNTRLRGQRPPLIVYQHNHMSPFTTVETGDNPRTFCRGTPVAPNGVSICCLRIRVTIPPAHQDSSPRRRSQRPHVVSAIPAPPQRWAAQKSERGHARERTGGRKG